MPLHDDEYARDKLTHRIRPVLKLIRAKWLEIVVIAVGGYMLLSIVHTVTANHESAVKAEARFDTLNENIRVLNELHKVRIQSEEEARKRLEEMSTKVAVITAQIGAQDRQIEWLKSELEDGAIGGRDRSAEANIAIDRILRELLTRFGASRAYLYVRHDGRATPDGTIHLLYYSMANEVVDAGISERMPLRQTLPDSMFSRWAVTMEKRQIVYDTLPEAREATEGWLYRSMRERGVVAVVACPVVSTGGETLAGFIGLDYSRRSDIETIDIDTMRPVLFRAALRIASILLK